MTRKTCHVCGPDKSSAGVDSATHSLHVVTVPTQNTLARTIAIGLDYDYDVLFKSKSDWVQRRGMLDGMFHDVNTLRQPDFDDVAAAVLEMIVDSAICEECFHALLTIAERKPSQTMTLEDKLNLSYVERERDEYCTEWESACERLRATQPDMDALQAHNRELTRERDEAFGHADADAIQIMRLQGELAEARAEIAAMKARVYGLSYLNESNVKRAVETVTMARPTRNALVDAFQDVTPIYSEDHERLTFNTANRLADAALKLMEGKP